MLKMYLCSLLLADPVDAAASDADQTAAFAAAGEAHLRRAMEAKDHPLDEFEGAHKNFESAYLLADDAQYLCRALASADLALHSAAFQDEQERLSWEERRREDLNRLRDDAKEKQQANCRFDAEGKPPPPRVAVLSEADAPEPSPSTAAASAGASSTVEPASPGASPYPASGAAAGPVSELSRPSAKTTPKVRAKTVSGSVLTAAGIGLLGGVAVVVGLEVQRAREMQGLVGDALAEQRKFTPAEDHRFNELKAELLHGRDVAIGVGVAGLVSVGAGVALLATRKKTRRAGAYAVHPYGGPQGVGAVVRLRF
ncbi:hypothetical protein OV203_22670 [Nannocystis sp. ILAH1]|uniref:hypothetical protein n=1 Tax=Nannocystis sp. ILAH1 TaxID=2996789 RepID=UPI00227043CE|nr:hypothetical protein [Nannocystis sp. ILAH1]MCY0989961.1 hypothetical protein [Nannocystis sp. ILAH1]